MRPFLGIYLTDNKKNEKLNGEEFLVAKPSAAMAQALEASCKKAEETVTGAKLPLWIRVGQGICGAVGAVVAIGILRGLGGADGVSLSQAYQNASWLFWLGGGCLLIWGILKLIGMQKEKAVLGTEESRHTLSKVEGVCNAIYSELAVPANACEVDILSFYYKEKDGAVLACRKGGQIVPYANLEFKAFADPENLYLANLEGKYAIPRSSFQAIRTVNKSIGCSNWNKAKAPDGGIYKPFKITVDEYGCIHCKPYHILEFSHGGETWGIWFPSYELPVFEAFTGLQAEKF